MASTPKPSKDDAAALRHYATAAMQALVEKRCRDRNACKGEMADNIAHDAFSLAAAMLAREKAASSLPSKKLRLEVERG